MICAAICKKNWSSQAHGHAHGCVPKIARRHGHAHGHAWITKEQTTSQAWPCGLLEFFTKKKKILVLHCNRDIAKFKCGGKILNFKFSNLF